MIYISVLSCVLCLPTNRAMCVRSMWKETRAIGNHGALLAICILLLRMCMSILLNRSDTTSQSFRYYFCLFRYYFCLSLEHVSSLFMPISHWTETLELALVLIYFRNVVIDIGDKQKVKYMCYRLSLFINIRVKHSSKTTMWRLHWWQVMLLYY